MDLGRHFSASNVDSDFTGVMLEGFMRCAFARQVVEPDVPQGVTSGQCDKAGLLFINNTGDTQDIMIATMPTSVPRFKTRVVEHIPRRTDIWVKGGQRLSYDLEAGVMYRFELNLYAQGKRVIKDAPIERLAEITIRNASAHHRTLVVNGDNFAPHGLDSGKSLKLHVPMGEIVLAFDAEDTPDATYLIVRPQPGMLVEMR
jgi:hypothetical protein